MAGEQVTSGRALLTVFSVLLTATLACCVGLSPAVRAAFPGSPGLIAVQRSLDSGNTSAIWVLDWQTGEARRLTHRGYSRSPDFSPDGRWIAFVSDLPRGRLNIWAIRPNGKGLRRLTKGRGELAAESPSFSTNGRWVAFSAESRSGRRQIERVAFGGGHRRVLVPQRGKVSAFSPSYSPDGRRLAWVQWRESRRVVPHIYIGRPDGRGGRRVTTGTEPKFSPDGRSIVFLRESRCGENRLRSEIDTMSLDTGQLRHVKSVCGTELGSPTYSPDGGWITYTVYSDESSKIAFSPVSRIVSQIAPSAGFGAIGDAAPSWQPIP
ncbi:MAG: hypothetical protein WD404_01660 [Solirubrobacterales bacterium]